MDNNFKQLEINGALVAMYKTESLKAVSIIVEIRAGSWYETGEKWGKAHLLEHMMFQGTEKFSDSGEMEIYKEENGIWSNASTGGQKIELMMRMPSESIGAGTVLLEEMLFKMTFSEEKLNKEKKVISQEYEDKWSKPNARFAKKVDEQYFGKGHLYTRDGMGEKDYVSSITRQELIDYQKRMIVPANMTISVVGNIDFSEIEKYLRNILVLTGEKVNEMFDKVQPQMEQLIHVETGMTAETVDVGWTTKGINELSLEDRMKIVIASYIIGGSPRSLLHTRVREDLGLAYSVYMGFGFYQVAGWISVRFSVKPENRDMVLREIDGVIEGFINQPIDKVKFERAKKYLVMRENMKYESTMGIAEDFCGSLFWEGKVILSEEYERILEKITEDQIRIMIGEVIGGRKPLVSIMRS